MGVSPDAHFCSRFFPLSTVIAAWPRTHNMFSLFWQLCAAGRLEAPLRMIVAWICRNGSRERFASCCRQETTSNLSDDRDAEHVDDLSHQNEERRRSWATTKAAGWLRRSGCMSCGCCITQRWAHGRKTWQWHLLSQLVPLSQLSDSDRKGGFSAHVYFKSWAELEEDALCAFFFLHSSSCLFTEQRRRFCSALPVWRSASGLIIHSTEQFKFTAVVNNNWAGAAEVAWCYLQFRCLWGYFLFLFLPVCLRPFKLVYIQMQLTPTMHSIVDSNKDVASSIFGIYCESTRISLWYFQFFWPRDSFLKPSRAGWYAGVVHSFTTRLPLKERKKNQGLLWLQLNCYILMSLQCALMPEDRTRLETLREHSDFKLQGEIIGRNERSDQCINEFVSSPFLIHFSLHLTCITGQGEVIVCVCVSCAHL